MKTTTTEKFRIKQNYGSNFIAMQTDELQEYIGYMKVNNIKNVTIHRRHGFKLNNIDFLKDNPFIEGVFVVDDNIDISAIHSLPNLKTLILAGDKKHKIDFACFPNLQVCNISCKFKIENLYSCKKLRELHLRKYNPKSKNLSELPKLPNLEFLELIQSTITSFAGVERFPKLKTLETHYMKNLTSLKELQPIADTLENLFLSKCPNLQNHSDVVKLQNVTWLRMSNCKDIASIQFIEKMPKLEKFAFVDTNVSDGDMTPCLGLKYAGFTNKRHFSHKSEQIRKMIEAKKAEALV